jgi:hypothetical protein
MAENSGGKQQYYAEAAKRCQAKINEILKKEKELLANAPADEQEAALRRLILAEDMFNLCSCYILENKIFKTVFNRSNEDILTESRKALFKGIAHMEDTVTNWVDEPFSEYADKIASIASVSTEKKYRLVRKMGLAIDLFKGEYEENSRWKWAFVDLDGRCAVIAKNIIDMRTLTSDLILTSDNYESTYFYVKMVKNMLAQAAELFRQKYELSSQRIEDFERSVNFLNALKRLHLALDERTETEEIKKTIEVWNSKLNTDIRKKKGIQ